MLRSILSAMGSAIPASSSDGLKLAATSVKSGSSLMVSVDVQNTGSVTGDEVVQLYTHQRSGSASRPVRELKGFRRITLKPGEKQTIILQLDTRDLGFWSSQTRQLVYRAWSLRPLGGNKLCRHRSRYLHKFCRNKKG